MQIVKNLAELVKVKTIVTLVVIGVFAALAMRGDIGADNAMIIISMVVSFYFGTQHEKQKSIREMARSVWPRHFCLWVFTFALLLL